MEPREAIDIIMKIKSKYKFNPQEVEAILLAIGVLDSAAFSKKRIRGILAKRKNNIKHN